MRHLIRLIVLRHIGRAPIRSALTVLGTAIAVGGLVAITSASGAVLASYEHSVQQLSGKVDLEIGSGDAPVLEALMEPVSRVRGISHVSPVIEAKARHVASGEGMLVLGVDFTGDGYFRELRGTTSEIDPLEFLNCRRCVLIAHAFARRHQIAVGDSVKLATPAGNQDFLVKDILQDNGPAQAYGGNVAIMYLDAAQLIFAREGRFDRIDVALAPGVPLAQVEAELKHIVGDGVPVDRPARRGERTASMMSRFRNGMRVISMLALLVSMFMIYNTIGIAVAQRRREIGVLRALGVTTQEIRALFVGEALAMAAVGAGLGLLIGRSLSHLVLASIHGTITNLYVDVNAHQAELTPLIAGVAVGTCLVTTGLSAYLPARVAARTPPALSMQRSAVSALPTLPWRWGLYAALAVSLLAALLACVPKQYATAITGQLSMVCSVVATACLAPALLEGVSRGLRLPLRRLLGVPGQLAADNLRRDGPRAVVTVAALMVGLALSLGAASFVSGFEHSVDTWLTQSIPADLFVTGAAPMNQGNIRLPKSLYTGLRALPHVRDLEVTSVRKITLGDVRISIMAVDMPVRLANAHFNITDGALGDIKAFHTERRVLISDNLAYRNNMRAGDPITLQTPHGRKTFTVQAVFVDYTSDYGAVMLDRSWYEADFNDTTVDAYEFYLDAPENAEALRDSIARGFGRDYDLFTVTNQQLRAEVEQIVRSTFTITNAMSVLAVIVALLGVMNTLIGAVVDRTRELGVLRAIGCSAAQVVQMFVYEAILLAGSAGILGLGAGQVLGILFVTVVNVQDTGWHVGFHPPWLYQAGMLVLAVAAAASAAIFPSWHASRQPITTALLYE